MFQCSNCGGNIVYNIESGKFKCMNCGETYTENEITDIEELDAEQLDLNQFTCPTCGGEIYSRDNTASGFCSFCGSSTPLKSRLIKCHKPNKIIPFVVTKEIAREKLKAKMKNWFTPNDITYLENLENYRGIYIPYWCYTVEVTSNIKDASVTYSRDSGNTTYYKEYKLCTDLKGKFKGFTYDASLEFPDDISEGLGSFDFKDSMIDFNSVYFSGFYADLPNVNPEKYKDKVLNDAKGISRDLLKDKINSTNTADGSASFIDNGNYNCKIVNCELVMCPVWFLSFRENNRVIYGVVNGINGRVVADIPISQKKVIGTISLLSLPIFAILYLFMNITIQSLIIFNISFIVFSCIISSIINSNIRIKEKGDIVKLTNNTVAIVLWLIGTLVAYGMSTEVHIVNDFIAYILAAISGIVGIFQLLKVITKFNTLSTRKLPQFDYKGGNTRDV